MKRADLEKKLRIAGCYFKRQGGSHSLWINPKTGVRRTAPLRRGIDSRIEPIPLTPAAFAAGGNLIDEIKRIGIKIAA